MISAHPNTKYINGPKSNIVLELIDSITDNVYWTLVIDKCMLKVFKTKQKILFDVQSLLNGQNPSFELKINSKSDNSLIWNGICKGIHDYFEHSMESSDCFELNYAFLKKKFVCNNTLSIDFELKHD